MRHKRKILVAIDGTETSTKTITYVAEMTRGALDFDIRLFHIIAPIPAELREHGGSEDPTKEEQLGQELREAQSRWIEEKRKEYVPVLERFKTSLVQSGVALQSISAESLACPGDNTLDHCILEAAQSWGAETIVIGWDSFPWFEELVKTHIAEKLIRKEQGLACWIVK